MRMVNVIEAIDGQRFPSEVECLDYERDLFQAAYKRLNYHFSAMFLMAPTVLDHHRNEVTTAKINKLILVLFSEGTYFNHTFKEDYELFSNKYPIYLTQGGHPIEVTK